MQTLEGDNIPVNAEQPANRSRAAHRTVVRVRMTARCTGSKSPQLENVGLGRDLLRAMLDDKPGSGDSWKAPLNQAINPQQLSLCLMMGTGSG